MFRQHGSSGEGVKHLHGQSSPGFLLNRNAVSCICGLALVSGRGKSRLETIAVLLRPWCLVVVPSKEPSEDSCTHLSPVQIRSQAEDDCINPRNSVSTAVRRPFCRSATMFATAPELIHRHSVMEMHVVHRGLLPKRAWAAKRTIRIRDFPHLLKLSLRIGVFETSSFPFQGLLSHALLSSIPPLVRLA